jgi:hypothetical protein
MLLAAGNLFAMPDTTTAEISRSRIFAAQNSDIFPPPESPSTEISPVLNVPQVKVHYCNHFNMRYRHFVYV